MKDFKDDPKAETIKRGPKELKTSGGIDQNVMKKVGRNLAKVAMYKKVGRGR